MPSASTSLGAETSGARRVGSVVSHEKGEERERGGEERGRDRKRKRKKMKINIVYHMYLVV